MINQVPYPELPT